MDNYLDEAGEADHGGHLSSGLAPDDKGLQGPAARVRPVFSAPSPQHGSVSLERNCCLY